MKKGILILFGAGLIAGCSSEPKISFTEIPGIDPDTAGVNLEVPPGQDPGAAPAGAKNIRGYAAKVWLNMLKNCMQSIGVEKGEVEYLGISNDLGLGTITDEDFDVSYEVVDSSIFTTDELKYMMKPGKVAGCGTAYERKFDLEGALESSIEMEGDDSLSLGVTAVLKNQRTVKLKVKSWQKGEILLDRLGNLLAKDQTGRKGEFIESLKGPNRIIMNRAITVNGFTAEIIVGNELGASARAQLVGGAQGKLTGGGGTVKVKLSNSNTLTFESNQSFILFGKYAKATKVKLPNP